MNPSISGQISQSQRTGRTLRAGPTSAGGVGSLVLLALLLLLGLGGCSGDTPIFVGTAALNTPIPPLGAPAGAAAAGAPAEAETPAEDADALAEIPAAPGIVRMRPAVEESREVTPTVTIRNRRVNFRSGPGTNFSVLTVVTQGTVLDVVGASPDQSWWQVCCAVTDDEPAQIGWVANSVVTVTGDDADTPVVGPLFDEEDSAVWDVAYACESERCAVNACAGTMRISASKLIQRRWMEFNRAVEWLEGCGENTYWLHQIDNTTGEERYAPEMDSPLFRYWNGTRPAEGNGLYFLNEQPVQVYCSGPHTYETDEGDGWTTLYMGNTCHDVRTGLLVSMAFERRWLYSGDFGGTDYEDEFFGDTESYEVTLAETTIGLSTLAE